MDEPVGEDATPPSRPGAAPPSRPPVRWGLGDFIWIYFAGFVASQVTAAIGFAISGDTVDHPGALTFGLYAVGLYGVWAAGLIFVSRHKGRGSLERDFGVVVKARRMWALVLGVVLQFALGALVLVLVHMAHDEKQKIVDDLRAASGAKLVVLLVIAGIVAPVFEETMFRGLLLRSLRRRLDVRAAIAISALVFAFVHLVGDASLGTLAILPALFILGVVSGIAAVRVGDLSVSIPLHMGFNLVTLAAYAFLAR